jgi:predicted nucleic acid-binding protein
MADTRSGSRHSLHGYLRAAGTDVARDPVEHERIRFFSVAIRRPEVGARIARDALDLFAPVVPITHRVMSRMPELIGLYPSLAARDLVHVATCLEEGSE